MPHKSGPKQANTPTHNPARKTQSSKPRSNTSTPTTKAVHPVSLRAAYTNPFSASPREIVQMQRDYGNRAVNRLIQRAQQPGIGREGGEVGGALQSQINSARGGGRPLNQGVGSHLGRALGADFSHVRVHTGQIADGLNRSFSAKAFTTGSDIFFSQGAYNPGTHSGQQLLAHELTHVVQQGGGQGGIQTKLTVGPASDSYEQEADRLSKSVTASPLTEAAPAPVAGHLPAQRIMRYSGPDSHYDIGHPMDAREPFTLNEDHPSVMPRTTGGASGLGAGWKTTTPGKPPLLISDDRSMAINSQAGEPREFYALQSVIDASNRMLETAESPVRLENAGNTITLNGAGEAMKQVQPRKDNGTLPGAGQFINLTTTTCRDVAASLIGGSINYAKIGGERIAGITTAQPTVIGGTHGLAKSMVENKSVGESQKSVSEGKDSEGLQVGKDYGTQLGKGNLDEQSRALGVNQFARAGVGEAYTTQRIENDKTNSLRTDFSKDEHGGVTQDFTWGYHYAAVVAESTDKADQVTLENYNRSGDQEEARKLLLTRLEHDFAVDLVDYLRDKPAPDLSIDESTLPAEPQARDEARKLRENANDRIRRQRIGEILHWLEKRVQATQREAETAYQQMESERLGKGVSMWYFRMVGSKKNQSFHEQMAASPYFSNPLTLAVGGTKVLGKTPISFTKASRTLDPTNVQMVKGLARRYLKDRAMGTTKKLKLTGYASGEGFGTAKMKQKKQQATAQGRANAVSQLMIAEGVDPNHIDVTVGVPDPTWSADQKRKVTVEVA